MKTILLPFLAVTALAGVLAFPVSLGAAVMLVLTAGLGAIILQDYSVRRPLCLPRPTRRRATPRATFTRLKQTVEINRLAA